MSADKSGRPVTASCHESGTWTALRPSGGPTADDDPLEKIEGRWNLQILLCLNAREHRFSDLRAAIPRVSANILTDRLRALECAGLVERHHLPPPHASHVYMLTSVAAALRPVLDSLASWRAARRDIGVPARRTDGPKVVERSNHDEAEGNRAPDLAQFRGDHRSGRL